jgi:hypothetical protein
VSTLIPYAGANDFDYEDDEGYTHCSTRKLPPSRVAALVKSLRKVPARRALIMLQLAHQEISARAEIEYQNEEVVK